MDDTVQNYVTSHSVEDGYAGTIDVVTGPSGRRRWSDHVKAEIVLVSYRDGVSVAAVARKHGSRRLSFILGEGRRGTAFLRCRMTTFWAWSRSSSRQVAGVVIRCRLTCQWQFKFPQFGQSKIPQFGGFGCQPVSVTCGSVLGWAAAAFWGGRRCDGGVCARVFRDQVRMAAEAIAGTFDLHDDGVV